MVKRIIKSRSVIVPDGKGKYKTESDDVLVIVSQRNFKGKRQYEVRQVTAGRISVPDRTLLRHIRQNKINSRQVKVIKHSKGLNLDKVASNVEKQRLNIVSGRKFGIKPKNRKEQIQIQSEESKLKSINKRKPFQIWALADVIDNKTGVIYTDRIGFSKGQIDRSKIPQMKQEAINNILKTLAFETDRSYDKISHLKVENVKFKVIYSRRSFD